MRLIPSLLYVYPVSPRLSGPHYHPATGTRRIVASHEQVAVTIGRKAIGRITVSAILPRDRMAGRTGPRKDN